MAQCNSYRFLILGISRPSMPASSSRGHRFNSTFVHGWSSDSCEVWKTATQRRQDPGDARTPTTSNVIPGHLLQVGLELQLTRISHSLDSSHCHISQLADALGTWYTPRPFETTDISIAPCGTTKTTIHMVPLPAMIPTRRMYLA